MKKISFKQIKKFLVKHVLLLLLIIIVSVFAYYYFTKTPFRENAEGQNDVSCNGVDENGTLQILSNVTEIKELEYKDCNKIIRVKIPKNITKIGNSAFRGCKNLKYIDIEPESLLDTIGDDAFNDCENLESIFLPPKVVSIRDRAFRNTDKRDLNGVKIYLENHGEDSGDADVNEFGQIDYFIINFNLYYSLNNGNNGNQGKDLKGIEKNKIYVSPPVFEKLKQKYEKINLKTRYDEQLLDGFKCVASITKADYDRAKENNKNNMIVNKSPGSNSITTDSTNLNSIAIDSIELNDKLGDRLPKECNDQLGKIIKGSEIKSIKFNSK